MADVSIKLLADIDDAVKGINSFAKESEKSLSSISKGFNALGNAIVASLAVFTAGSIVNVLEDTVKAALESEEAVLGLSKALKLTGEFTPELVTDFTDFASALELTTNYSDEAILAQVKYLKSLGATNTEAKTVTKTAIDLAAALGVSLDTAVEQLRNTFTGSTGKLGKYSEAIRNLTPAQLKAGEAVNVLSRELNGLGKISGDTTSGAILLFNKAIDNLKETIGKLIVENPAVTAFINTITSGINKGIEFVNDFAKAIPTLVSGFIKLTSAAVAYFLVFEGEKVTEFFAGVFSSLIRSAAGFQSFALKARASLAAAEYGTIALKVAVISLKAAATLGLTLLIDLLVETALITNNMANFFPILGQKVKSAFLTGIQFVSLFGEQIFKLLNLIPGTDKLFGELARGFKDAAAGVQKQIDGVGEEIVKLNKPIDKSTDAMGKFGKVTAKTGDNVRGLGSDAEDSAKKIKDQIDALSKDVKNAGINELDVIKNTYTERLALINKARILNITSNEEAQKLILNTTLEYTRKTNELVSKDNEKRLKDEEDARKRQFERIAALSSASPKDISKEIATGGGLSGGLDFSAIGGSIIKSVSDGAKGAESIISGIVTVAATSFLGPIGQVVGQIFDVLAQSPGKLKDMIAEFFKAIPEVISNVIQNIPNLLTGLLNGLVTLVITLFRGPFLVELINSLLNGLGEFVFALISQIPFIIAEIVVGIPQIIQGLAFVIGDFVLKIVESAPVLIQTLVNSLPTLIESLGKLFSSPYIISALVLSLVKAGMALIKLMPVVAITMAVELAKNAPTIVTAFIDSFISDGVPQIAHALAEWIEALNPFKNNGDGNGAAPRTNVTIDSNGTPQSGASVSGLLNSIFGTDFKFAEGGMIPRGFPNDTFPAKLTSGEFVIDRSLTSRLTDYLNKSEKPEQSDSAMLSILQSIDSKIAGQPITIQIGSKTIFAELKDELRSGRVLA